MSLIISEMSSVNSEELLQLGAIWKDCRLRAMLKYCLLMTLKEMIILALLYIGVVELIWMVIVDVCLGWNPHDSSRDNCR